jgi:uncharacterized protein (TIGR00269 family)
MLSRTRSVTNALEITSCDRCHADSIIHQPYSGRHLCGQHLADSVRKRISKALRAQLILPKTTSRRKSKDVVKEKIRMIKILVAVSGGKDSALMLNSLFDLIGSRPDVELIAGIVDEGIAGYRSPSIICAEQLCDTIGIRLERISYTDLGFAEMDDVVNKMDSMAAKHTEADGLLPCSYCGVFRRQGINALAQRVGAEYIAIGHNLDDVAQSVLMNMQRGDIDRTIRLAPHTDIPIEGLAPRIVPLRWIPEQEVHALAIFNGLQFHHGDCPYAAGALRQRSRDFIAALEADIPGSRHGLVHSLDRLKELNSELVEAKNAVEGQSMPLVELGNNVPVQLENSESVELNDAGSGELGGNAVTESGRSDKVESGSNKTVESVPQGAGRGSPVGRCQSCGEITGRKICQACSMKAWLEEE